MPPTSVWRARGGRWRDRLLEHLFVDPFFALREIRRVLTDEGRLYLFTDNLYALKTIRSFVSGHSINDAVRIWRTLEEIGHRGHVRLYSRREVVGMLQHCGLRTTCPTRPVSLR